MNLRIPGPTPVPPEILSSLAQQMINHRGKVFADLLFRITDRLKSVFGTTNDILILTASGTGGMEAAIVNTLSPGQKILAATSGVFGNRFAEIARAYGAQVTHLEFPWGKPVNPQDIKQALIDDPELSAVLVTHNETSTGITNDLQTIAQIVKQSDKLLLVDAISSLGSVELPVDQWECDVVITGSQKGWMVPPGLTMISVSKEAWEAHKNALMPRFYFDFTLAKRYLDRGQTPATPALSILFALDQALEMMEKEGLDRIHERHARIGAMTRQGIKDLGLTLFADEDHASNTVTAFYVPTGIDAAKLIQILEKDHQVVVAGGQGPLQGKILRIGHLGHIEDTDIYDLMNALGEALFKAGFSPSQPPRAN